MTTTWNRPPGAAPDLALSRLAGALNREWRHDYQRRPVPPSWTADARLARYRNVAEALAELEDEATEPGRVDDALAALGEQAAAGDPDAARVVVQYLLPCLCRVAYARYGPSHGSAAEALDDLLSTAWETARAGVELRGRRPKIALLRTIEHRALRKPGRAVIRQRQREVLVGAMGDARAQTVGGLDPVCVDDLVADRSGRARSRPPNAGEELVEALAAAAADGVSRRDTQLVGALYLGWWTCTDLGATRGVTARRVRYLRADALRRLAAWAA